MSTASFTAPNLAYLHGQAQLPTVARLAVTIAVLAVKWDMNRRSRKTLSRLDPHQLRDIGISQSAAMTEANKRFYQS